MSLLSAISSPESASGPTLCGLQAGPMTAPSGQAPALASLSPRQAKEQGLLTSGTYGPPGTTSSQPYSLLSCLASRLKQRFAMAGSILFKLTWKESATPSGLPVSLLRASAHRISDSDCGSWPTPNTPSGGRSMSIEKMSATGMTLDGRKHTVSLEHVVKFASWPSPHSSSSTGPGSEGRQGGLNIQTAAQLAAWPTTTRDWKGANAPGNELEHNARPLNEVARLAAWQTPMANVKARSEEFKESRTSLNPLECLGSWPTPLTVPDSEASHGQLSGSMRRQLEAIGPIATGSPAGTGSGGQLNPAHSRWLMGLPAEWDACAPTATRSSRRAPKPSSDPPSKLLS